MKIRQKSMRIGFLIFFVLLLIIVIFIIKIPRLVGNLFNGNHITINLVVSLDEKEISLDNLKANCIYERKDNCIVKSDNGSYKTIGGEYGLYEFEIVIPSERLEGYTKDIILNLNYLNTNNWYISDSDCKVVLTTDENDVISSTFTVKTKYNDKTSKEYKDNAEVIDNIIDINFGL